MQRQWVPRKRGNANYRNAFGEPRYLAVRPNLSNYRPVMPIQPPPRFPPRMGYMDVPPPNFMHSNSSYHVRNGFEMNEPCNFIRNNSKSNFRGRGGGGRGGGRRGYGPRMQSSTNNRQNGQNANGQQENEKKKEREPSSCPFFCKSCDKGYMTEENYNVHCSTHMECPGEGCSYVAAAKLVQLHYDMQHKTGLAKKIWKLESAEDIAKWREERRRNYPTQENIQRKQQELAEKRARGEVLETKQFGKMKGRSRQNRKRGSEEAGEHDGGSHGNRKRCRRRQRKQADTKHVEQTVHIGDVTTLPETPRTHGPLTGEPRREEPSTEERLTVGPRTHGPLSEKRLTGVQGTEVARTDMTASKGSETSTGKGVLAGALGSLAVLYGDTSSDEESLSSFNDKPDQTSSAALSSGQQVCGGVGTDQSAHISLGQSGPSSVDMEGRSSEGNISMKQPDSNTENETDSQTDNHTDSPTDNHTINTVNYSQAVCVTGREHAVSECREHVVSECREHAVSECREHAVSECREHAVSECREHAVSECREHAVSECREHAVSEDSGPECRRCVLSQAACASDSGPAGKAGKKELRKAGSRRGGSHSVPPKRFTLLQRLLAPDIRHERNVILQCIRHIVNNDFLGVPKWESSSKPGTLRSASARRSATSNVRQS